jgi:uncharacterized protein (DUF427 family)
MSRDIKIPGPDHPITVTPSGDHVVVRSGDATIADSRSTLVLREANYPPVRYIPLADLDRGHGKPDISPTSSSRRGCSR